VTPLSTNTLDDEQERHWALSVGATKRSTANRQPQTDNRKDAQRPGNGANPTPADGGQRPAGAMRIDAYREELLKAGFEFVEIVDSGADLNAYAKVENQAGCCSPAMETSSPNLS
jgi:hypothetical protein